MMLVARKRHTLAASGLPPLTPLILSDFRIPHWPIGIRTEHSGDGLYIGTIHTAPAQRSTLSVTIAEAAVSPWHLPPLQSPLPSLSSETEWVPGTGYLLSGASAGVTAPRRSVTLTQ